MYVLKALNNLGLGIATRAWLKLLVHLTNVARYTAKHKPLELLRLMNYSREVPLSDRSSCCKVAPQKEPRPCRA